MKVLYYSGFCITDMQTGRICLQNELAGIITLIAFSCSNVPEKAGCVNLMLAVIYELVCLTCKRLGRTESTSAQCSVWQYGGPTNIVSIFCSVFTSKPGQTLNISTLMALFGSGSGSDPFQMPPHRQAIRR
jgi:hypothetical protein